jgi:hypothetical protein
MEFFAIMAVGTVLAVLVVLGCRPSRPRNIRQAPDVDELSPRPTPPWKKDISLTHPIGELQYLEQIERYNKDPQHQPFPLQPPPH